jgi:hypothetical protein
VSTLDLEQKQTPLKTKNLNKFNLVRIQRRGLLFCHRKKEKLKVHALMDSFDQLHSSEFEKKVS